MSEKEKQSGYLNQSFRLFHLKDKKNQEFEYHFHDFNKIIIFLSGNVTYLVEGKAYHLKPWDILLINNHDIHKPIIHPEVTYERIVIWLKNDFIKEQKENDCDLSKCFSTANEKSFNLIRLNPSVKTQMQSILYALEGSLSSIEFGSEILSKTYFLQLLVYINRVFQTTPQKQTITDLSYDKQIAEILKYINLNLNTDLSNDTLAKKFFLSKYYLMHKFKEETGFTLHSYIQKKRLLYAADLIKQGIPVTKAATQCGFSDYSTFLRAFKKIYHISPKQLLNKNN